MVKMQELIWYVSEHLDTANSVGVQELIKTVDECLGLTQMVMSNRTDLRLTQTSLKKESINVVFCTAPHDPILHVHDLMLLGRHNRFSLLIMVNMVDGFQVAEQVLLGLFKSNFENVLLYYYSSNGTNELFGYLYYPKFHYINFTNIFEMISDGLQKQISGGIDLQGYKLYTPLGQSLPHVFSYKNRRSQTIWSGPGYELLKLFADYCNASLVSYEMPKDRLGGNIIDMKAALDLIRHKKVDVMAHAYALYKADDKLGKSYPLMVVRWCLMVPLCNSISTMYYPIQPFDELVWLGIIFTFVALLLLRYLWCCWLGTNLSDSILESVCMSIGLSTPGGIVTPSVLNFFSFACIFFYGFFLTANYTSLLGSILTVTIFHEQINTMDDLIASNTSVMIIDYEMEFLLSEGAELPANFTRLLLPVDPATFNQHQVQLNTSFAYFITEEKWQILNSQQQGLKQRIFKLSDICFGSYHLSYPVQPNWPLQRNLAFYIYRIHSSGLFGHFMRSAFDCAVHAGIVKRMADSPEFKTAGMQHLFVVFSMLLVMLTASVLIFVVELVTYRLSRRRGIAVQ
ncbi:uncharacterized protein LOC126755858 [Bactrocera neohumeralis]|uniref:uncharacterized protein LOC126755858 n=1 Tax=Bactrocera neohumeralis TaxID=98809 RepID=UPI00216505EF|nr:uncharacterized protein LOC126755858 [Bactrocera neohumeralis]